MSKAQRNKAQSARARIAAQQQQQRQAEARRRLIAIGGVAITLIVVVVIIIVASITGKPSQSGGSNGALPAGVQAKLNVPTSTLASVGVGTATPRAIRRVSGPALTSGGKPEMLYIGAEWCPYCAAERWSMAVALSRFGTFSALKGIHSSANDVYPNTATLTFYQSTYSSKYLVFTPVETEAVDRSTLQRPTSDQQALWSKYLPPGNSFPFIDIGNMFVSATTYNPGVLQGLTWSQIAADVHNPASPVAQGVVGSANLFTAAICQVTGNQPASVCNAPPVTALKGTI